MSFIHSLKRAFGLGEDFENEELEPDYSADARQPEPEAPAPQLPVQSSPRPEVSDASLSADIFDSVVKLFNETQPEFVRNCLDTDAQKQFILSSIDDSVRKRLADAVENSRLRGQALWTEERSRLGNEVEALKKEKESLEQKRDESKTARLSAERQKRALIERVHDLETQLMTIEAEKEQYLLENRSMLNKLRVASVTSGGSSDEILGQIDTLNEEIKRLTAIVEEKDSELELYHGIINTHRGVLTMLLTNIANLKAVVHEKEEELAAVAEDVAAVEEAKSHIENFGEIIAKKDKRIAALKDEREKDVKDIADMKAAISDKDSEIAALRQEIEKLNSTIAQNIADNAKLLEAKQQNGKNRKKSSKKPDSKPRISAIDDLLDGTDWLVSVPPPPAPKDPDKDDDFGYKAPPKKINLDEDKQLSLW